MTRAATSVVIDTERSQLELVASRRPLTKSEDERLAELCFQGDRRGYRMVFAGRLRPMPQPRRGRACK